METLEYWKKSCLETEQILHDVLEEKGFPTLEPGQEVWILNKKVWDKTQIIRCYVLVPGIKNVIITNYIPNYPDGYQNAPRDIFIKPLDQVFVTEELAKLELAKQKVETNE